MAQLSRIQIAAVKRMAKSIQPLENKMDKLEQKKSDFIAQIDAEISVLAQQVNSVHQAIESFTGGLSLTEVLNPEAMPTDYPVDDVEVDESERPEEVDVTAALQAMQEDESEIVEEVAQIDAEVELEKETSAIMGSSFFGN